MPFKSEKQRKWMHANEPEMAKDWEKKNESPQYRKTNKVDCPKCNGEGCDHCGGKGYHINEGKLETLALNLLRNINKETGISKYDHTKTAHFNKVMKFLRSKMRNTPDKKLGDIAMSYDQYRQKQPKATIPDIDSVKNMEKTLKKLGMKESVKESKFNKILKGRDLVNYFVKRFKYPERDAIAVANKLKDVGFKVPKHMESVNEAGMELNKLKDAIKMFQKKIKKQGRITNARDADHLKKLIKLYRQMGGKGVNEKVIKVSKKDDVPGNVMKMSGEEKIKKLTYSGSNGTGSYEIKGKNLNVIGIRPRDKGFFVRHFTMKTGFRKANLYYDGVSWMDKNKKF